MDGGGTKHQKNYIEQPKQKESERMYLENGKSKNTFGQRKF